MGPSKTSPSHVEVARFSACQMNEHEDCAGELILSDENDLSKPRRHLKCACKCHKKETVVTEYSMLSAACNIGKHEQCTPVLKSATKANTFYKCNCSCHRRGGFP